VPTIKKPIGVRFSKLESKYLGLGPPTHLPRRDAFNHCRTSSQYCAGALSCSKYKLYITARNATQGSTVRTFHKICHSIKQQTCGKVSPVITAVMFTLKCIRTVSDRMKTTPWPEVTAWKPDTPSSLWISSSANRLLCKQGSDISYVLRSQLQNIIRKGRSLETRSPP
jgi:hypothetical protein